MDNKQIIDFYNQMNLTDLEYFLNLAAIRMVVPLAKEDDMVLCDDVYCAVTNGTKIDLITKEFAEEMEKRK
tara:strand:+ start:578 stop:790 length:213 start_codon:yes stop_codon:yes gene_type:complete